MCGITGYFNLDKSSPNIEVLQRMGQKIAHRGPDHEGFYTNNDGIGLCHRRLSIIDLSEAGNQPMSSTNKEAWIVYNGEIYNYKVLKESLIAKGYIFRTKTDTEVILNAYLEYGEKCVEKFNGMFAFVIWDEKNKKFFAARDRIGIKPFYYFSHGLRFVFGSEIKAILAHPDVKLGVNKDAVNNYLLVDYPVNNETWYEGIYSLEPGTCLTIVDKKLSKRTYWTVDFNIDHSIDFGSIKAELNYLVTDAVKLHWQSDVEVGAHLSGGVDSSTIVSVASKVLKEDIHTFSSVFDLGKEFDERREIELVVKDAKTTHHQISITADVLRNELEKIIYHMDEPVVGPAILPMYKISELVKKAGIKVVNGGQGVDELFGGYKPYFSLAVRNILLNYRQRTFPKEELLYIPSYLYKGGTLKRLANRLGKSSLQDSWIKGNENSFKTVEIYERLKNETENLHPFESSSYVSLRYYLPALLHQEDRMSMAWSIESRVPMLDNRIVDLALKIPSWFKVSKGVSKSIFRESVRGIVPDEILDNKIKRGYPTPTSVWFANDVFDYLYKLFESNDFLANDYVNRDVLLKILKDQRENSTNNISAPIWKSLVLHTWLKINFEDNEKGACNLQ